MKKAALIVKDPYFQNNRFFSDDLKIVRDNQNTCYAELKKELRKKNVDISTEDINPPENSEIVIKLGIDEDDKVIRNKKGQIYYALLQEPPGINDNNWKKSKYNKYDRVFTWREDFVDNKKVFLLRFGYKFDSYKIDKKWDKRKFVTAISGFKNSFHPLDLYKQRMKTYKYLAGNFKNEFDFYGQGWGKYFNLINKIRNKNLFECYKGKVFLKKEILDKYKFCICYENRYDLKGYVTEKIFDCFSAGCIPIYWGAKNIEELIPKNCYIDRRIFSDNKELFEFVKGLNCEDCKKYLVNINNYLKSKKSDMFSYKNYAKILANFILEDLKEKKN